ncbi:MAG: hypothetical protein IPM29_25265 [Planctomycetes bacterium]|nr:hypothetical protein [Planctomycetota bacterium]
MPPIFVHADHRPFGSPLRLRDLFDLAHISTALHRFRSSPEFLLDDLHTGPHEHTDAARHAVSVAHVPRSPDRPLAEHVAELRHMDFVAAPRQVGGTTACRLLDDADGSDHDAVAA